MPSSTSSSDAAVLPAVAARAAAPGADHYARQTAADRPGVAQPVPTRPVPTQPWGRIILGALLLLVLLVGAWEAYWRNFGARPGYRNTYGLWAIQRRRIDAGEGDATVLVGASRIYYDLELPVWERLDGKRPIQLAFEGTSPLDLSRGSGGGPEVHRPRADRRGARSVLQRLRVSRRCGALHAQGIAVAVHRPVAVDAPDRAVPGVRRSGLRAGDGARAPALARATGQARVPWSCASSATTTPTATRYLWDKVADDPEYRALCAAHLARRLPALAGRSDSGGSVEDRAGADRARRARGGQTACARRPGAVRAHAEQRRIPASSRTPISRASAPGTRCSPRPGRPGSTSRTTPSCRATTCPSGRI